MPKRVLFITGTRADYGKLRPLIERVDRAKGFDCHVFATGMHTLSRYGSTYEEIEKRGSGKLYLYINQSADNSAAMDMVLASTITGLGHYIREFRPDLLVVHGDRVETLAGAIVGALNDILVSHMEGGEISGTVDELIRHAVSKLSHAHFVANEEARDRLIQMGEITESIFVTGSADIDVMLSDDLPTLAEAKRRYELGFDKYCILVYHPVTTELDRLDRRIKAVVAAVRESGRNFVIVYPNNDPGADRILAAIRPLADSDRFRLFPSLRFEYFLTLLKHADAIVGNSSAGVREAPVYGVPAINIGSRQRNRFRYPSIINVAEDREQILWGLRNLPRHVPPSFHFGRGRCADEFMSILRGDALWGVARQKQFRDMPEPSPIQALLAAGSVPTAPFRGRGVSSVAG